MVLWWHASRTAYSTGRREPPGTGGVPLQVPAVVAAWLVPAAWARPASTLDADAMRELVFHTLRTVRRGPFHGPDDSRAVPKWAGASPRSPKPPASFEANRGLTD